jgi:hypothetical protein
VGAERLRLLPQPAASQRPTGSRCQQGGSVLGNAVRLAWMCTLQALSVLLAAASVLPLMGTAANTTDTVYAGFTARTLCEGVPHLFTKVSKYVTLLAPHQHGDGLMAGRSQAGASCMALSDSDANSTRLERLCSTATRGVPAAGRFVSGREVADVWAAEGCAFNATCNTYARFSVPGAANTAGRKSGSVAVDTRGAAVTAAWPAGSVTARFLDDWFGCQLSFSFAQARARLHPERGASSALGVLPLPQQIHEDRRVSR